MCLFTYIKVQTQIQYTLFQKVFNPNYQNMYINIK